MLQSNRVDLQRFAVLVGRNASGKSTLMSALRFVSVVLSDGVERAIDVALDGSGASFRDLCFDENKPIAIALEVKLQEGRYRYELEVGPIDSGALAIAHEHFFVLPKELEDAVAVSSELKSDFGDLKGDEIIHQKIPKGWRKVVSKTAEGSVNFRDENEKKTWNTNFRFSPTRSALGNILEDADRFPGAIAVRNLLRDGVRMIELDSHKLRMPSPPRSAATLSNDGGNLAVAAHALKGRDLVAFDQWMAHVSDAIPGLTSIDTWERPEDKHVVLRAYFDGNHTDPVPSWLLSDGTLRLLALSLLAFAEPEEPGLCLVEEPENGLHPLAIQSVFQALSQMRKTQVFIATHSPVFLAQTSLDEALVFRRTDHGTSQILRGREVADLGGWKGRVILADLFATGVL
ncbi:MAG: ATP-binding protein [Polyangiaceae bacterium]|nr:ATP-binding protein [Polyangiaceae bacterium]